MARWSPISCGLSIFRYAERMHWPTFAATQLLLGATEGEVMNALPEAARARIAGGALLSGERASRSRALADEAALALRELDGLTLPSKGETR